MVDDPTKDTGNTDPKEDPTFTQADIDAAVTKAGEPYKDFDKIKADADEYGLVKGSPRFDKFVEDENKRYALGEDEYEKMYGPDATPSLDGKNEDTDDGWTDNEKAMRAELNTIKETLAQSAVTSDRKAIADELTAISSDKDRYPLFDKSIKMGDAEVPVRELMARELDKAEKAGRDLTMAQAYREATYEHQREIGRNEAEGVMQKKRDAARVGLPVSSPGRKSEGAKTFKSPEEAVEATLDELGI